MVAMVLVPSLTQYFRDNGTLDQNTADNEFDGCEEDLDIQIEDPEYDEKDDQKPVFESFSLSFLFITLTLLEFILSIFFRLPSPSP